MSRDREEKVSWNDSVIFNDPRQIAMSFIENPGDEFSVFHKKNPWIWRHFRTAVLQAVNDGQKKVDAFEILKQATNGVVLRDELVRQYKELFVSNHQELEHVFIDGSDQCAQEKRP